MKKSDLRDLIQNELDGNEIDAVDFIRVILTEVGEELHKEASQEELIEHYLNLLAEEEEE